MIKYMQHGIIMILAMIGVLGVLSVQMNMNYAEVLGGLSDKADTVVVIDAGHGGIDPGKVGVAGTLEKDINLAIAAKVKRNLEHQGITVIVTRDGDYGLYSEGSSQKKREDMRERMRIINNSGAVLAVSIHQNSFTNSKYSGAQVFYNNNSSESSILARCIQQSLIEYVDNTNTRQEKANGDYYLLKNAQIPIVIAECGFLSNASEEKKLNLDEYQEKLAWAIHMGIMKFMSGVGQSAKTEAQP